MQKKIFTWYTLIYPFIACIIAFNFLDFNIELAHSKLEFFFDSDMLYLHRLFMDVFFFKHNFLSWNLTPAPYFFPDMLMFFILEALSGHCVFFAIIGYSVFQYLLLLFLSQRIASIVLKSNQAFPLICSVLLLTLIFLVIPAHDCYRFAIRATYHFGGIINGLLLIVFILYSLQNAEPRKLVLAIGALVFLSSASDPLFIMQFAFPAILLMLILRPLLLVNSLGLLLLAGLVCGSVVRHYFSKGVDIQYLYFDPLHFYMRLKFMANTSLPLLLQRHPWLGGATLGFYVVLIIQLIFQRCRNQLNLLRLFIILSVLTTLLSVSLVETNGSVFQRYMLNFYFFPLIFSWLPFSSILVRINMLKITQVIFIFSIGAGIYLTIAPFKKLHWEYYPPVTKCIDDGVSHYNQAHNENIQYGIASYWQAGVITSLSKENLRVVGVDHFLTARSWINNPEMLKKKYDFAVIALPGNPIQTAPKNILSVFLIEKINGKPVATFQCNNEAVVMIYGKNKLYLQPN